MTYLSITLILIVGYKDQIDTNLLLDKSGYKFTQDELISLNQKIDKVVPANCAILQLPQFPFPENPPINSMSDYDSFLPILFSSNKKFTYGSVKESKNAIWMNDIIKKYDKKLLVQAKSYGFCGILIDTFGLQNSDKKDLKSLIWKYNISTELSESKRWEFVDLSKQKSNHKYRGFGPNIFFSKGFFGEENEGQVKFRWINDSISIFEIFSLDDNIKSRTTFEIRNSPNGKLRNVKIYLDNRILDGFTLKDSKKLEIVTKLSSRKSAKIKIFISGDPTEVSGDPRKFYGQIFNPNVELIAT